MEAAAAPALCAGAAANVAGVCRAARGASRDTDVAVVAVGLASTAALTSLAAAVHAADAGARTTRGGDVAAAAWPLETVARTAAASFFARVLALRRLAASPSTDVHANETVAGRAVGMTRAMQELGDRTARRRVCNALAALATADADAAAVVRFMRRAVAAAGAATRASHAAVAAGIGFRTGAPTSASAAAAVRSRAAARDAARPWGTAAAVAAMRASGCGAVRAAPVGGVAAGTGARASAGGAWADRTGRGAASGGCVGARAAEEGAEPARGGRGHARRRG